MAKPQETYVGARNLVTEHPAERYPGLTVVKGGPAWNVWVICLQDGETLTARGGEQACGYQTVDGGRAQGFALLAGDRATLVRSGLPHAFVEWRVERSAETSR